MPASKKGELHANLVEETAWKENGWYIVAQIKQADGGVVLIERRTHPFPDKPFATARYSFFKDEVSFYSGEYDLTEEEAIESFAERSRHRRLRRLS